MIYQRFSSITLIAGIEISAGSSREQEFLIRKPENITPEFFFLWAASDCRFARFSRFQRLRVTNLHRKISKKSKICLLEVKLQHKVQNIFWGRNFSKILKILKILKNSFENRKIKFSKIFEFFKKFEIFRIFKNFENFPKIRPPKNILDFML